MADFSPKSLEVAAPDRLVEFEHPLAERIRTFLRIELLNQQACFHAEDTSELGARAALSSLLDILNLFRRGDVRMEVIKELDKQRQTLASYIREPGVDHDLLEGNLEHIEALQSRIGDSATVFPNLLKDSHFLFNINHRSSIPGGTCIFDLPDYGYWLKLPYEERSEHFQAWLGSFTPIFDAVTHIMWLIRQNSQPVERTVNSGLYQTNLQGDARPRLIRVLLPAAGGIYPEISAGKQRFTLRFVQWRGTDARRVQAKDPVTFLLALC
ncbi:MAG: cell division protein ZapD [Rhodospirillales bacterium]|nr:cell division protein ZapD [Rhodospirillales bacterium]